MRLTVVGCSGSVPGPEAACSSYLVEQDGLRLLLDLGTGSVGALQRFVAPSDVDAVVITHRHADHWGDLPDLGYLRTLAHLPASRPLIVVAPSDLPSVVWDNPSVFDARAATAGPHRLGPFDLRIAAVEHTEHSFAVRVGDALCYTGDTAPCDALDDLAAGCAVLLAEASGLDEDQPTSTAAAGDAAPTLHAAGPGHLTAGDAGRLAARSGTRLLIITHLRPWQDLDALLAEASAEAGCPVLVAHPGLRVAVPPLSAS